MKHTFFAGVAVFIGIFGVGAGIIFMSPTAEAKLSQQSPNPIDVSAGGASGGVSHMLKHETVANVKQLKAQVYYPDDSGAKSLQIRYGIDGKKCRIFNLGNHFNDNNANVIVTINGAQTYEYVIPISRVCDNQQNSSGDTRNNVRTGQPGDANNNKFFANYDLPPLTENTQLGLFVADITIRYSNAVNQGQSQENSVNFVLNVTGSGGKGKVGPVELGSGANANKFGLRSAFYLDSQRRDVKAKTQFGIPCNENPGQIEVQLFDPDVNVFGTTLIYVSLDGKKLPASAYGPATLAVDPDNDGIYRSTGESNVSSVLRINNPKSLYDPDKSTGTFRFHIENKVTSGRASPNGNVLSVGIPYSSIYGDIKCGDGVDTDEFDPSSAVPDLVVPNQKFDFVGKITGGEVEKKPSESSYRGVPYRFHQIRYKPGVNPYGTGDEIQTRLVDDIDCSYFTNASPPNATCSPHDPGRFNSNTEDYPAQGQMNQSGGTVTRLLARSEDQEFPPDQYSVEPGSTICYAVSVKQPAKVLMDEYDYTYTVPSFYDSDGDGVDEDHSYSQTDPQPTQYYYSDENYTRPSPRNSSFTYTAVKRKWVTAISCVMVGKRPSAQIVGNDLRVRSLSYNDDEQIGGDAIANITEYEDGLKYGSWVEYGAFVFGADKNVGSGAGLRGGSIYDISQRGNWSKLTFANDPEYGGYVKGYQNQPGISDYVDGATSTGAVTLAGRISANAISSNPSDIYRANTAGTTIELEEQSGITGSKLIYVNGDVTIAGNITLADTTYTDPADIPQVIIVANNINILDNVSRIDAWLITYQIEDDGDDTTTNGNIDTCSNGPPVDQRNSNQCNTLLEVFGPVLSQTLELNRTGPVAFGPDAPAERFNGRLEGYFWAYERQQTKDTAQTVNIVEAPVRF